MMELPLVAGSPVCPACEQALKHRPFPGWVKLSFLGILVLMCIGMVHNWRFFQGYFENQQAQKALRAKDVVRAADLFGQAHNHVPESQDISVNALFFGGLKRMGDGNFAEGVAWLRQCQAQDPSERDAIEEYIEVGLIQDLMEQKKYDEAGRVAKQRKAKRPAKKDTDELLSAIQIAKTFDAKDYDGFFVAAQEQAARDPNSSMASAQVASALACKYAVTGDDELKRRCLEQLEKARALAKDPATFEEYRERIMHRINSREIIDKEEYDRRFRTKKEISK